MQSPRLTVQACLDIESQPRKGWLSLRLIRTLCGQNVTKRQDAVNNPALDRWRCANRGMISAEVVPAEKYVLHRNMVVDALAVSRSQSAETLQVLSLIHI